MTQIIKMQFFHNVSIYITISTVLLQYYPLCHVTMSDQLNSQFFRKYTEPTKKYCPYWTPAAQEPTIASRNVGLIQIGSNVRQHTYIAGHGAGVNRFPGTRNIRNTICFAVCFVP